MSAAHDVFDRKRRDYLHLGFYLGKLPRLVWRSWRMSKQWPWKAWEPYLNVPLAEIRREFGIRIF